MNFWKDTYIHIFSFNKKIKLIKNINYEKCQNLDSFKVEENIVKKFKFNFLLKINLSLYFVVQ